ncbi:hypothetical protein Xcel_3024 [Xylanimonas cellulosilytica DSM 15894]|uniref:DUF2516 domain-containing protein n=1 Tax=Xylanimonas cellulosilytica (strain DSM 15894 / JCM 12276 / CECT 5975 / KCTC 9989 / LMG 20990 / NBRC 107835 / XIL07) TaxID=446471 RepID=D1BZQ2_XYLCX|nr:DUF2516 family protein [Xylanimonas cellulosilytica]ACZ32030.1 hypothetical protein Xcel_3024 [Xylanimonas cellulosilytica DSM 15894]
MLNLIRELVALAVSLTVLVVAIIAIADAARRPERAFAAEGKATKTIWTLVLGGGLLFAVLGALGMIGIVLNIIAIGPAAVYWYGVRPTIKPYGTGGSQRPQGPQW